MKTFTNFLKVIAIAAVIGIAAFAPAKIHAQQSVNNTKWARQMRDDDSRMMRDAWDIVTFEVLPLKFMNSELPILPTIIFSFVRIGRPDN